MVKKLIELPLAASVHAPSGRGSVEIDLTQCINCQQDDAEKITVIKETEGIISHSMSDPSGEHAEIYHLKCDLCDFEYELATVTIESKTPTGTTNIVSVYIKNQTTGKWSWLGYF
ncbi:hypothetical protein GF325_13155 [Candidatus Bathyarchaeota archaeon]|nr:hypothetical protein [Candidatus Bathyarchaeota archaeon]